MSKKGKKKMKKSLAYSLANHWVTNLLQLHTSTLFLPEEQCVKEFCQSWAIERARKGGGDFDNVDLRKFQMITPVQCSAYMLVQYCGGGGKLYHIYIFGKCKELIYKRLGASQTKGFRPCWKKLSLASTRFLEHLKTPTDGALSTQCLPSPSH